MKVSEDVLEVILKILVQLLGGLHRRPVVQLLPARRASAKVKLERREIRGLTHPRLLGSISLLTSSCRLSRLLLM